MVSTAQKRSEPGYSDLQMTRSMCDWRASDMVLPNPQFHTFKVKPGQIYRVCLASDGLWDVCSFEECARREEKCRTARHGSARHAPGPPRIARCLLIRRRAMCHLCNDANMRSHRRRLRSATQMMKAATVEKAAKNLLKIPEKEYLEVRGHELMDDDTTIIVVELNPSGVQHSAPGGGGGCCSLM